MSSSFAVGGLASGLDTKSIIAQLMSIEQQPLNLVKGRQTAHSSKMAAIQTVKDQISALQGAVKSLADRSKMNAKVASTDTPFASPAVLNATATADAINGSFKVTVSQLATATRASSAGPLGTAIDATATLANAGFRYSVTTGSLHINGQAVAIDTTTTLNSLIGAINGAGAGVTASLVADADGRADNRAQIVSAPGQSLQLGALGDTSNALRLMNLADAPVSGYTAANTNSGGAADAGALDTSITINGVTTSISQGNAGFDGVQNADFIAQAINGNASNTVTAAAQLDGTITLTQKTAGSQQTVAITAAGTGTGLGAGTTQNGTDRVVSTTTKLTVDDGKLSKALSENPQAVEAVLAGFAATLGTPTITNITGVTGTPQIHQDGTYHIKVTDATTGAVDASFVTPDGRTVWTGSGTMAAGQDNFAVVPGLKIAASAVLTTGAEDTFSIGVTNRGVGVSLSDYVDNLLAPGGYFNERKKGDDAINSDYNKRIADMQDRLDAKQASLERKYTALETAMSKLQSQGSALASQIAKLNASG